MSDINTRDSLYNAIYEYNQVIVRPGKEKLTDLERTGIFFTILRRHLVNIAAGKNRYGKLTVNDIKCTFKPNGELNTLNIKKFTSNNGWDSYDTSSTSTNVVINNLKRISDRPVFYRTPDMNEIADIVNQIK